MSGTDLTDDGRFDARLRELGPDVPRPELDAGARDRLMATLGGRVRPSSPRAGSGWMLAACIGLVVGLGIWCVVLGARLGEARGELAASRGETDEAIELLMRARRDDAVVEAPADLAGVRGEDLVLVAFHHDLCPISRYSTPGFEAMAARRTGDSERFLAFDVTGAKRDAVEREIAALGLGYALLAPLGAETGVVKVVDTRRRVVLSSAPGRRGLEYAEALLARVTGSAGGP